MMGLSLITLKRGERLEMKYSIVLMNFDCQTETLDFKYPISIGHSIRHEFTKEGSTYCQDYWTITDIYHGFDGEGEEYAELYLEPDGDACHRQTEEIAKALVLADLKVRTNDSH